MEPRAEARAKPGDEAAPMKAILLAAGRGARMRPLTDRTPKPLLPVGGRPLIEWQLLAMARAGVRRVVVNTAWLEDRIVAAIGDGARFGVAIRYSTEGRDHGGALETAGGIATALPLLVDRDDEPFWIASADIWAPSFPFDPAAMAAFAGQPGRLAHLWLAPNPPYHPGGDFVVDPSGLARPATDAPPAAECRTYANLALARPALVAGVEPGTRAALGPLLFAEAAAGRVGAAAWDGDWENIGTPEQLAALDRRLGGAGSVVSPPAAR